MGTGSSAQSVCSFYTVSSNINCELLVNFKHRFKHFNHEDLLPHLLEINSFSGQNMCGDTSPYDPNHNTVQQCHFRTVRDPADTSGDCAAPYPDMRPHCSCNIHIHYNISFNPLLEPCQWQCASHSSVFPSELVGILSCEEMDLSVKCDMISEVKGILCFGFLGNIYYRTLQQVLISDIRYNQCPSESD